MWLVLTIRTCVNVNKTWATEDNTLNMLSRNYYLLNTIIKKNVVTKHDHTYVLPINFLSVWGKRLEHAFVLACKK
jgi:hypothetical protein